MSNEYWLINSDEKLQNAFAHFRDEFKKRGRLVLRCEEVREAGSQSMLNTWMMWMGQTAKHMAAQGVTMPLYIDRKGNHHGKREFTKDDAHALFTMTYLGADEQGRRKTWSRTKNPNERQASMEDRIWAMDRHVEWCAERGIFITIPQEGEYQDEKRKLEAKAA